MKHLLTILILLSFIQTSSGQSYAVRGSVADTLNVTPLYRASVTLMRTGDSGIIAHTRSGPDGRFELGVAKEGKYIIRITFVSFADYVDVINVNKPVTDIGEVPMITREHLLTEFVLTQQIAAIKIKGDTTEYMADSFKVKEGANVEDLLRRLPGIQVDKNGKITAQGETVQKILVDGEEFFSDDPKVVTQGLQSAVVNKVQVFDKKSDQAEFTGIDDGVKTKTINLELKEDKKKGYFGKLDAGAGTDGYFQEQGMLNAFKGKRQISVFGITSNTDKVGLDWQDNDKFGGGAGLVDAVDNNNYNMVGGSYDEFGGWSGTYEGQGLPKVWTGGFHFADRWNQDKSHVSGSYRYAIQNVEVDGDNITQYALGGDTLRVNKEHKDQVSRVERHGFNGFYEWKLDTNTSIRIVAYAGLKNADVSSVYHTQTYDITGGENGPATINDRKLTGNTKSQFINTDLLLRKKFSKKGRTLSVDIKEDYNDSKGYGYLDSKLYTPNTMGGNDITSINQKKTDSTRSLQFAAKATYTEPLSKVAFAEIDYGISVNNSTAKKYSYGQDPSLRYDIPSDSFSSNYKYNILTNQAGLNFKFVYKNYNFSFGTDVSTSRYLQTDLLQTEKSGRDSTHTYNYPNIYPKATFVYKFGKQTSLRFNYEGSSKQPTISQIQPLSQNTDPLNVTVGNPNLKQQFSNKLHLNFNDYKILTHRYFYVGAYFSSDINAISTSQTINGPVSTTQYINVNGNYNDNWWFGYDFKIKDLGLGFSADGNNNHNHNMINGQQNITNNAGYNFGPNFSVYKEDKYDISLEPHAAYNDNRSTVSTYTTHYWALNTDFRAEIQITKTLTTGTTVNAMLREKTTVFPTNNEVIKWNAYVSKKLLKKKQLEVKATLYDILNQNTGYTRTASGSTISQQSYSTIRRYGMISLVWNFTHTPTAAVAATDEKK